MLNVKLHHLSFTTDNLANMVSFYRDQMGMIDVTESGDSVIPVSYTHLTLPTILLV